MKRPSAPKRQHDQYHSILDNILESRQMPTKNQGKAAWQQWLRDNPARGDDVRAALTESVEQFRSETGIDMMGDLWTEMSRQGWMLGR